MRLTVYNEEEEEGEGGEGGECRSHFGWSLTASSKLRQPEREREQKTLFASHHLTLRDAASSLSPGDTERWPLERPSTTE